MRHLLVAIPFLFSLLVTTHAHAEVTVVIEEESPLTASAVGWRSSDFVVVVFADGTERLVGIHKIRAIVDESGQDRTEYVLQERKAVGTPPPGYEGRLGPDRPTIGRALLGGVLVGIIALAALFGGGLGGFSR